MSELRCLLYLLNATNLIFKLNRKIFDLFPNIIDMFSGDIDLEKLGFSLDDSNKIKNPDWSLIENDLSWVDNKTNHIISINDKGYPRLLKEIQNPPILLFVKGDLSLLNIEQIAVVGSRNATPIGLDTAFNFSKEIAKLGIVITSGLAVGIDSASHEGSLAACGRTIAVMGTGLNKIYPARNINLAERIVDSGGALISEFPLSASGKAWHFPMRNRIISGLSMGTLVVEANMRSGSLITARVAGEQGREVFAIPGSIYSQQSRGCHHLIRQGAKIVEKPNDILEEFSCFSQSSSHKFNNCKMDKKKNKLDRWHNKLLDCMGFDMVAIDILVARMNLPASRINSMLLELEMEGVVKVTIDGCVRVI